MSEYVYKKVTENDLAREMLEREEKAAHDVATIKGHAHREGFSEGYSEGRTEGISIAIQNMKRAIDLAAKGKTAEEIGEELGLPVDVIRQMLGLEDITK